MTLDVAHWKKAGGADGTRIRLGQRAEPTHCWTELESYAEQFISLIRGAVNR
jgi:hypothetical protein